MQERCHREMLMLVGQHIFGCPIGEIFNKYSVLAKRLPEFASAKGRMQCAPTTGSP
jgi:hypothetical protein